MRDSINAIEVLSQGLHEIVRHLEGAGETIIEGGLGGRFGYGPQHYRNDVFQIHAFCYCDQDDCPWCTRAETSADGAYYIGGEEVTHQEWEKFLGMGRRVGAENGQEAPNFWHFSSGLKVRWYKYIGRGMELNMNLSVEDITKIINECIASIK